MFRNLLFVATFSFALLSLCACSKDDEDVQKVEPPRMFSRIYSLYTPEILFLNPSEEEYGLFELTPLPFDFWPDIKALGYKGINGFHHLTRGYQTIGDGGSELIDSIGTAYYGENEVFVEGQDSLARADLIYRLKSLRIVHIDKITKVETDVSKDFTISYCSFEKYMKERPKKMENVGDYIYAVTKPLNELTEEDCKWMGWYWKVNNGPIIIRYNHKYAPYEPNFRFVIQGNDTERRLSVNNIRWRK